MEEKNINAHLLRNLISAILRINNYKKVCEFINNIDLSNYPLKGLYAQCVSDLKLLISTSLDDVVACKKIEGICNYYLECALGQRYNPLKKHTESRKEKYRQLNLDIPKKIMDDFDECLKKNEQTKKSVILQAIQNYIDENRK